MFVSKFLNKYYNFSYTLTKPILYLDDRSPPCRSVLLLIKALNIDVELKLIDLFKQEHLKEDFRKINPLHTVPALQHNNIKLTDSHAILMYLSETYGKNSNYYPEDLIKRFLIINRLFFNASLLFRHDSDVMSSIFSNPAFNKNKYSDKTYECYDFLEIYLTGNKYMAGNTLTIADFSIVATLSTLDILFPVLKNRWCKLYLWFDLMKNLPFYSEANKTGLDNFKRSIEEYSVGIL